MQRSYQAMVESRKEKNSAMTAPDCTPIKERGY